MHSGESDFDPPRFKPNPSVYLKAAETEGKKPENCIAVEDSGSGVGSASNAGVGEAMLTERSFPFRKPFHACKTQEKLCCRIGSPRSHDNLA